MVAMENFEKCTVAMLGGPCMQHVTGNTSRLNQPQSAIIYYIPVIITCIRACKINFHIHEPIMFQAVDETIE